MVRFFDEDRFEIYANRDIEKDEELLHVSTDDV
jgi:SET domain-containing protein